MNKNHLKNNIMRGKNMSIKLFYFLITILVISILFGSCNDLTTKPIVPGQIEKLNVSEDLIGTWVFEEYEDDITVMQKLSGLDSSKYGFIIYNNGKFLERKNSGFCGTPPISYANFEGTWEAETDNELKIIVDFWGGIINCKMQIVSLTEMELKFKNQY